MQPLHHQVADHRRRNRKRRRRVHCSTVSKCRRRRPHRHIGKRFIKQHLGHTTTPPRDAVPHDNTRDTRQWTTPRHNSVMLQRHLHRHRAQPTRLRTGRRNVFIHCTRHRINRTPAQRVVRMRAQQRTPRHAQQRGCLRQRDAGIGRHLGGTGASVQPRQHQPRLHIAQ